MQKKIPQLDGVRGIAILVVIMHNESGRFSSLHLERIFRSGWMGVDLFFVLSGLLITRILINTKTTPNYFRNFYVRRCLRIWPLYYALLFFMFVVVPFARPSEASLVFGRSSPWWAYPLFLQNFLVPNSAGATGPLGVTWSLAVEEQFYLFWPLVVRYCNVSKLRRISLAVVCASPVLRLCLSLGHVNIYSNPFCRLDGLMAGAFIAATLDRSHDVPARSRLAVGGVLIALPLALWTDRLGALWVAISFITLAAASFVYLALFSRKRWFRIALSNRFLVHTGTVSYGLYLLHKIPFDAAQGIHVSGFSLLTFTVCASGGYAAAVLSWELLEKPLLRLKRHFPSGSVSEVRSLSFETVYLPARRA